MADISNVLNAVGGAATGGVIGILGSLGNRAGTYIVDRQKAKDEREAKKIDYQHELEMAQLTQDRSRQEAEENFALKNLEYKVADMQAAAQLMLASINDQTQLQGRASQWVVDIMSFVRPALTILLILVAAIFGFTQMANPFYQTSMMATMAVAWWFGDRQQGQNRSPPSSTNKGKQ